MAQERLYLPWMGHTLGSRADRQYSLQGGLECRRSWRLTPRLRLHTRDPHSGSPKTDRKTTMEQGRASS